MKEDIKPITLRLPKSLRDQIDKLRGDVPRNTWILRHLEAAVATLTQTQDQ